VEGDASRRCCRTVVETTLAPGGVGVKDAGHGVFSDALAVDRRTVEA
jgi:hypothetical protein